MQSKGLVVWRAVNLIIFMVYVSIPIAITQPDTLLAIKQVAEARELMREFRREEATPLFEKGFSVLEAHTSPSSYVPHLSGWASELVNTGYFSEGLKTGERAFGLAEKITPPDSTLMADICLTIGVAKTHLSKFREAREWLQKSQVFIENSTARGSQRHALILTRLGFTFRVYGENEQATDYFQQALDILHQPGNGHAIYEAWALKYMSMVQEEYCNDAAVSILEKALQVLEKANPEDYSHQLLKVNAANIYEDLCMCERYRGNLPRAKEYLENALQLSGPYLPPSSANILARKTLQADIYKSLGQTEEALKIQLEVFETKKQKPDSWQLNLASDYNVLGSLYFELERYSEAVASFESALSLAAKSSRVHIFQVHTWQLLGMAYRELGDTDQALVYLTKALRGITAETVQAQRYKASVYNQIGQTKAQQNQPEIALKYFQLGIFTLDSRTDTLNLLTLPAVKPDDNYETRLGILKNKANLLQFLSRQGSGAENYSNAALNTYLHADTFIQVMRQYYPYEESRKYLSGYVFPLYEAAIEFAARQYTGTKDPKLADLILGWMEKTKSLQLLESIERAEVVHYSRIPASIPQKEAELKTRLLRLRRQIEEQKNLGKYGDIGKIAVREEEYYAAVKARDSLREFVIQNYPNYYNLKFADQPVSLSELQKHLQPGQLLLSTFRGDRGIYLLSVENNRVQIHDLPVDDSITFTIKRFRELFSGPPGFSNTDYQESLDLFAHTGYQLFARVFAPVIHPESIEEIIFIPDGEFSHIPLEVLPVMLPNEKTSFKELPYLLRSASVRYGYSATLLTREWTGKKSRAVNYAGFAPEYTSGNHLPPLKYNRQEVEDAHRLMGGKMYLGPRATKTNFLATAGGSRILHLAMHSHHDPENPLFSGLVFAAEKDSAGAEVLHAYELLGTRLSADVAILSACNSGYGVYQKAEGMISVARSFAYAGCPSLFMNLWQAEDVATGKIVRLLFSHLTQGEEQHQALRNAKLEYLASAPAEQAHPFFWGGMIQLGDNKALDENSLVSLRIGLISGLLILVLAGIFFLHRQRNVKKDG